MDSSTAEERHLKLSRAMSYQQTRHSIQSDLSSKYKTASPSLLARFRLGTIKKRHRDAESSEGSTSRTVDDLICLDSFEESFDNTSPHIDINRETLQQAIQEQLRSLGHNIDIFGDVEKDRSLKEYSNAERNFAFLAAAMANRYDLFEEFLALNVDEKFRETKYGFGALHFAAFCGSTEFCGKLLSRGVAVNPNYGVYTPLCCSVLGEQPETIRRLVSAGANLNVVQANGDCALASAVRAHSTSCVSLLVDLGADVNVVDSAGATPLHIATDLGDAAIVKCLLDSGKCNVNCKTKSELNTPLHLAALGGSYAILGLLLERGALADARNARLKTPLHFASRVCIECTELLLKKGADPNAEDIEQRTPLHAAVARSEIRFGPDITKLLLSWNAAVNKQDRYGYTALHIAALNELPECAEALLEHGADVATRTRGGTAALGLVARKTPCALSALKSVLDSYITCNDPEVSYKEVKLSFNFKYLLQGCERGEMNFLQTIVNEGQRSLLEHPLCEAFLYLKWKRIRKYYIARLLFCLIFVVLLSMYVLVVLAYQCYEKIDPKPDVASRFFIPINYNASLCNNKSHLGRWLRDHPTVVEFEWHLLAFVAILEILRKIYGFNGYVSFKEYFNISNIVEWFVVAAVFATSYIFMNGPSTIWQNHVGAFAVLIGWTNLMVMIGHLPIFGSYVTMYTKVQKEFAKLLSAYICLLIGFTICFCAIFVKADAFDNPLIGFVKILVMMTGEFDFNNMLEDIGHEKGSGSLLEASALTTFVLFLLFVTIILINLLVGIAVHDIQGLQKTAGLSKLVGMTNLITHIECALFGPRVPSCLVRLLSTSSGISSLVTVNPLNPRETRLPRDILRSGLEVARQARAKRGSGDKRMTLRRSETLAEVPNQELMDIILRLSDEVRELKKLILGNRVDLINN